MRIEVNLAHPESRLDRTLHLWAPVVIVLASILLVKILVSAGHEFTEYRSVHRSVLRYQAEISELEARESRGRALLRQPPTVRLYDQINFLNFLIDEKRVSLADLTFRVTKLLPGQARLTALSLVETKGGPVVDFSIEGASVDAIYGFLNRLEESSDFGSVTVNNQAFEAAGVDKGLVTLSCSAQYLGPESSRQDPAQQP